MKKWPEIIKFYDLEGDHIRNNDQLYDNLIVEYQNNGSIAIPWYMIVNKEGKIVARHAKRPSDKEELIPIQHFRQYRSHLLYWYRNNS